MKVIPYYEQIMETLSPLTPRQMKTYRGGDITEFERIETEMMIYEMRCFETDKLDKITTIKADIAGGGFVVQATTIVPADEYPLPIFGSEILQAEGYISLRVDFYPLADCARDMDYYERYMEPMEPIWEKYKDIEGVGMEKRHWAKVMASPFYTFGKLHQENIEDTALDLTIDYLKLYVKFCSETEKSDPTYMTALNERKRSMLDIFRERDPGEKPLKKILGEEKAHRLIDLLF
jgi:15,16-dihydrobiliverdin:ferredoxin oxidoreductase